MKSLKIKTILYCVILLNIFILLSCQKEQEVFSCDPDTQQWVVDNKNNYTNISRGQFALVPYKMQIPLYRSFSPVHKWNLWNEKIDILMSSDNFTITEKVHIGKLKNFIQPSHFGFSKNKKKEFDEFANLWEMHARDNFHWDDRELFVYFHTLLIEEELYEAIRNIGDLGTDKVDCECLYDIYCYFEYKLCDKSIGCLRTDSGCGLLGNSRCNGICD